MKVIFRILLILSIFIGIILMASIVHVFAEEKTKSNTYDNFNSILQTEDFKNFSAEYYDNLINCKGWVSSGTACYQNMITQYQNQLLLDKIQP